MATHPLNQGRPDLLRTLTVMVIVTLVISAMAGSIFAGVR
jgi:ABC-type methionine transport system permease subunit